MTFEHSSNSVEFFTPPNIITSARNVMESIELDVFSCEKANAIVNADRFIGRPLSSFEEPWKAKTVLCNPPGGVDSDLKYKWDTSSIAGAAFNRLMYHWVDGYVEQAIYIGFNSSILHTAQVCLDFPVCYFSNRIRFWQDVQDLKAAESKKKNPQIERLNRYISNCKKDPESFIFLEKQNTFLIPSRQPKYNNVVVYLPPFDEFRRAFNLKHTRQFKREFSDYGKVVIPSAY